MILSFWFAKGAFGYLIQSQSTRLLGPPFTSNNLSFRAKRGIRCLPATPRTLGPPLKQLVIPSKARNPLFASDATDARPAPPTICHSEQGEESAVRRDTTNARPLPQTTCHSEQGEESAVRQRRHERLACPSNNLSFRAKRGIRCLPATPRTLGRAPQTICHSEQSEESAICWRRHRRSACPAPQTTCHSEQSE